MTDSLIIPIALILMGCLLSWFIIGTRGNWILKLIVTIIAIYISFGVWAVANDLRGWPTSEKLPIKYRMHWIIIKEPNKKTGEAGEIYILAEEYNYTEDDALKIFKHNISKDTPRWYKIPYTREVHEQAERLTDALKRGEPVVMERKDGEGIGSGNGDDVGSGAGLGGDDSGEGEGGGINNNEGGQRDVRGSPASPLGYRFPTPTPQPKLSRSFSR